MHGDVSTQLEQRDAEIARLRAFLEISRLMNTEVNHAKLIERINETARRHLNADRLTVFFYDRAKEELYSYIASGLQPGEIRIPANKGIAGHVFETGEMVCLADAYDDPRFNPAVDRKTGYRTRSILSLHITNRQGVRFGVVQALNKQSDAGVFTEEDMIFLWEVVDQISDLYAALEEAISHLLIFSLDKAGVLTYASPAMNAFTGYNVDEVLGGKFSDLVFHEDLEDFTSGFQRVMNGAPSEQVEYRVVTKAGDHRWMRASNRPIYDDNVIVGVQGQLENITERKQLEDNLRQAQKIESIGQLAGGIAHDFNNLLLPIIGYAEMSLPIVGEQHPVYNNLLQVQDAANRAKELTNQLLAFSRKQVLRVRTLDLSRVVRDFDKILSRLIGENVTIETDLDDGLLAIKADESQIQQILMNLAVNARDAMTGSGRLTIRTANVHVDEERAAQLPKMKIGDYTLLSVTDTGCGMDADTLARIFEPFFTTKEQGKGTGLGLATVYGIVKQHGGCIAADSEVGRGTTFDIYLPAVEEEVEREKPKQAVVKPGIPGTETILVVEDEAVVRDFVCEILKQNGYQIIRAEEPMKALDIAKVRGGAIDLLLTDIIMPQMNGKELYQKLSEIRRDLKVLYMSGYTDDVLGNHGVLEENVNFIQKPFTVPDLTKKVREAIEGTAVPSERETAVTPQ